MRSDPPIFLPHSVRDPIHGTIRLSSEELSVINHAIFRRLHHIRQNALLYYVFPTAKHTRFEHSLGVMHLVDSSLRSLLINSMVAGNKPTPAIARLENASVGQAINLNDLDDDELRFLFRIGRLSGLVHDLGHGPFSHTFDAFAPTASLIENLISRDDRLNQLRQLIPFLRSERPLELLPPQATVEGVKHEIMSCVLFALLWNEVQPGEYDVPAAVAAVILGEPTIYPVEQYHPLLSLLHDLVASAPADADRMDYLERDSRSLGVSYGLYDRNRLLKSFLVYLADEGGRRRYRLGVKRSGVRAIENFVQARFELYVQIYYHKTNTAVNLMLEEIAKNASRDEPLIFKNIDLDSVLEIYLELSDERFLRVLMGGDERYPIGSESIVTLATDIFHRRLWKRIYEGRDHAETNAKLTLLRDAGLGEGLFVDHIDPKATKDLSAAAETKRRGAAVLVRGNDGFYELDPGVSWMEASPIIFALSEVEAGISRIYFKGNDRERVKHLQDLARNPPLSRAPEA